MKIEDMSNTELLALLVGRDLALRWAGNSLAELFGLVAPRVQQVSEVSANYALHPALAAAKELVIRCLQARLEREDVRERCYPVG
jgi:hypothetical protein